MSLKDESGHGDRMGWYGAALVFAAGMTAAFVLMGSGWRDNRDEGDALALRAVNTRPLVIVPLPRS